MSLKKSLSWRLSLQAWLSLLALGLILWLTISYADLVLQRWFAFCGACEEIF